MINRPDTRSQRIKRHKRVRAKISGTPERPRLNVFRSETNIYAQIIDGAMAAGIETGVYFFAQAITVEEAIAEADFVISLLEGHEIDAHVAYDW